MTTRTHTQAHAHAHPHKCISSEYWRGSRSDPGEWCVWVAKTYIMAYLAVLSPRIIHFLGLIDRKGVYVCILGVVAGRACVYISHTIVCLYMYIYIYTHICMNICMNMCVRICTCMCMHMFIHACIRQVRGNPFVSQMYSHTHIHVHTVCWFIKESSQTINSTFLPSP